MSKGSNNGLFLLRGKTKGVSDDGDNDDDDDDDDDNGYL